ncbi:unnamed protein product [Arctogadus glacialis]
MSRVSPLLSCVLLLLYAQSCGSSQPASLSVHALHHPHPLQAAAAAAVVTGASAAMVEVGKEVEEEVVDEVEEEEEAAASEGECPSCVLARMRRSGGGGGPEEERGAMEEAQQDVVEAVKRHILNMLHLEDRPNITRPVPRAALLNALRKLHVGRVAADGSVQIEGEGEGRGRGGGGGGGGRGGRGGGGGGAAGAGAGVGGEGDSGEPTETTEIITFAEAAAGTGPHTPLVWVGGGMGTSGTLEAPGRHTPSCHFSVPILTIDCYSFNHSM